MNRYRCGLILPALIATIAGALAGQEIFDAAVERDKADLVKRLIASGAEVECRNKDGFTPFMLAALDTGSVEVGQLLLDHGADGGDWEFFISFEGPEGQWLAPLRIAPDWRGYCPTVSPEGRDFFYVAYPGTPVTQAVHWVDADFIERLRPGRASSPATPPKELKIIASPAVALYGEPFSWRVTGLDPGERVTLKATSRDARKVLWTSEAVFQADASGTIDVGRQAPVSGGYGEADIFGLLWSLKPADSDPKEPVAYRHDGVNGWMVHLEAVDSAGAAATTSFRCVFQRPGEALVRVPLEKDGLRGFLYHPASGGPFPGVIVLGGSEGGLYEGWAQALASNGFAALTLAWFNYQGLPDELVEIPLEYFDRAAAWMTAQAEVRPGGLGLMGGSKGGEAVLIAAANNKAFQAVVALTPAAHMWEGHTLRFFSPDYTPVSSWSLGGKPLPFISFKVTPQDKELEMKGELESFVPFFRNGLAQADPTTIEKAAIPVEKINGSILLVSGTDDQIWPAGDFCAAIVARLKKAGFPHEVTHLIIEGGGHNSVIPFLVTANRGLLIDGDPSGGSPQADARGGYRSWAETLAFLHRHLGR